MGLGSAPTAERSRSPLWQWPAVACLAAVALAVAARSIRPEQGGVLEWLPSGDHDSVRALLQVTTTSVMTATTLTFSLTIVTLQLASQQFSPRLLREFTRDPVTKAVLSVLAATFVFTATSLALLDAARPVPRLTAALTLGLAVAAVGAILAFLTHIVRAIRVDTMMLMVHNETSKAITIFYPVYGDAPRHHVSQLDLRNRDTVVVDAADSGFVQLVHVDQLVAAAREHRVLVRMDARPGDHLVRGTPLATVWPDRGSSTSCDGIADAVRAATTFGYERTLDQDAGFGFRQLEDIAVKAMSPSVNDPVTAATAVGHMGDLLVRLTGCRLGPTVHADDEDHPRAIVPDRDLRYYLDLTCGQLRRYGAQEPTVLGALLRILRDLARACRDDDQRDEVRRAACLVLAQADGLRDADLADLRDLSARVEQAAQGDTAAAYGDRAGETRSI